MTSPDPADPNARADGLRSAWAIVVLIALAAMPLALAGKPTAALMSQHVPSATMLIETLGKMVVVAMTGLSALVAFRAGLKNFGAEGQWIAGVLAALGAGALAGALPPLLIVAGALIAATLAGAAVMGVITAAKHRLGADEAVATLLFNVVATLGLALTAGVAPFELDATGLRKTFSVAGTPILSIDPLVALAVGASTVVLLCLLSSAIINRTVAGFALRAVGANAISARLAGIDVGRVLLGVALFSGACAGLAGGAIVAGVIPGGSSGVTIGMGYAGLAAALFSRGSPLALVAWAPAMAALLALAETTARIAALPPAIVDIFTGLAIVAALIANAPDLAGRRRHRRRAVAS